MLVSEFAQVCGADTLFITYYEDGHFQIFRNPTELVEYLGNATIDYIDVESLSDNGYIVVQVL